MNTFKCEYIDLTLDESEKIEPKVWVPCDKIPANYAQLAPISSNMNLEVIMQYQKDH